MDWQANAMQYLCRIDDLSHNIKATLKTCNNSNITKATRQDIHDLDFEGWQNSTKKNPSMLTDVISN